MFTVVVRVSEPEVAVMVSAYVPAGVFGVMGADTVPVQAARASGASRRSADSKAREYGHAA